METSFVRTLTIGAARLIYGQHERIGRPGIARVGPSPTRLEACCGPAAVVIGEEPVEDLAFDLSRRLARRMEKNGDFGLVRREPPAHAQFQRVREREGV